MISTILTILYSAIITTIIVTLYCRKKYLIQKEKLQATLLKQSCDNFSEFSRIISHDLRAPFRAITTLAQFIFDDNKDRLDKESKENFDILIERSKKVYQQIETIFTYSKVGNDPSDLSEIVIYEIVQDIINLGELSDKTNISFNNFSIIKSDLNKIKQIFELLINYTKSRIDPNSGTISIDGEKIDGSYLFTISDNGPLISSDSISQIFQIFNRQNHETNDISLAVSKKLINSLGGEIKLLSSEKSGTSFSFTIPKI